MTQRILKIIGRTPEARRTRLELLTAWMARRGWRMADYAEEAGSALFERPEDAPPLPRLDATRWLPGPEPWKPGQWIVSLRSDVRLVGLPALVLALGSVLILALFAPSSFDESHIRQQAAAERWYLVTANQLNVREKPAKRAQVVGVLYRDQRVLVEGEVDAEWVKVGVPERGYVARSFLAPAVAPAAD